MSKTYTYTEGTPDDTIEVSDECMFSMDDSKFQIDIQASNYADQVYTLNYIENIFDNLNNVFDGCKRLITSAKNYINENRNGISWYLSFKQPPEIYENTTSENCEENISKNCDCE